MLRQVLDVEAPADARRPVRADPGNLGQEAVALAINSSPDELFPEPARLADVLCEHLRRYVPLIEM